MTKTCMLSFLAIATSLTACVTQSPQSSTSHEQNYTLSAAANAAGKEMAKNGLTEFTMFNIPEANGNPEKLLSALRQAKAANVALAITSPKIEFIRDMLDGAMKLAKDERFDGLCLIIVGQRIDESMFGQTLEQRGIKAKYTTYE